MKIKAYICPSCVAPLDVNYDTTFTFCPNCGNRLHISYEGEAAPKKTDLRQFTDANTGTPLASAVVPPDYALKGALNTQWQSDSVPFTATVQAVSPDRSVILTSSSKETFEEIRDPIQKNGCPYPCGGSRLAAGLYGAGGLSAAIRGGYVRRSRYPHCQSRAAQRLWDAFAGGEGKAVGLFQRPCHQYQCAP